MRGAGMAAAYGAGSGLALYVAFRIGAWIFDRAVGVWCQVKDKRAEETP